MSLLWLIPSLVAGVAMALFTHSWLFLVFSLITTLTSFWSMRLRSAKPLEGMVHISGAGVAIGNKVLPRSTFFWKPEWRQQVLDAVNQQLAAQKAALFTQELVQNSFRLDGGRPISAFAGFGSKGAVSFNLAEDEPHLLVIGPTGSGKSRWLELHISSLISSHSEIGFWHADYKGGATLGKFATHHSCIKYTTDLAAEGSFWMELADALHQRERDFVSNGISRIEHGGFQRQIVVVDELLAALRSSSLAASTIEAIATRGRSLGIHLIVATQGTSGLGRVLLTNLRAKLVMFGTDTVDLAQLGINHKFSANVSTDQARALLAAQGKIEEVTFPLVFSQADLPALPRQFRGRRQLVR